MVVDSADRVFEVEIDGKQIPVWIFGEKHKKTLFVIHGYPLAFSEYVGDLPIFELAKTYKIIAFDLPGFGSAKAVSGNAVDYIEKIRSELDVEDIVIFGLSFGGAESLLYALKYPQHVNKVVVGGMPFVGFPLRASFASARIISAPFNKRLHTVFQAFSKLSKKRLSKLKKPVLLLYSKLDTLAKPSMGQKLFDILPNSELFITESRTHGWLMHNARESGFLGEIERFFKKVVHKVKSL